MTELHQIMADQHRIVPVYWSASQLLSKLEQQKSPTTSARHSHHHHLRQQGSSPPGYESPPPAWHQETALGRPMGDSMEREDSEELDDPSVGVFSRNSVYRSTCRGGTEPGYHDNLDVAGIPGDIPEKYFVTVSGFPPEQNDSFSNSSREFVGSVPQGGGGGGKPRNITEV